MWPRDVCPSVTRNKPVHNNSNVRKCSTIRNNIHVTEPTHALLQAEPPLFWGSVISCQCMQQWVWSFSIGPESAVHTDSGTVPSPRKNFLPLVSERCAFGFSVNTGQSLLLHLGYECHEWTLTCWRVDGAWVPSRRPTGKLQPGCCAGASRAP